MYNHLPRSSAASSDLYCFLDLCFLLNRNKDLSVRELWDLFTFCAPHTMSSCVNVSRVRFRYCASCIVSPAFLLNLLMSNHLTTSTVSVSHHIYWWRWCWHWLIGCSFASNVSCCVCVFVKNALRLMSFHQVYRVLGMSSPSGSSEQSRKRPPPASDSGNVRADSVQSSANLLHCW